MNAKCVMRSRRAPSTYLLIDPSQSPSSVFAINWEAYPALFSCVALRDGQQSFTRMRSDCPVGSVACMVWVWLFFAGSKLSVATVKPRSEEHTSELQSL